MSVQYVVHAPHDLPQLVARIIDSQRCWWSRNVDSRVSDDGDVQLIGRVGSYYQKQLAQEALRQIRGLRRIYNELQVTPSPLSFS